MQGLKPMLGTLKVLMKRCLLFTGRGAVSGPPGLVVNFLAMTRAIYSQCKFMNLIYKYFDWLQNVSWMPRNLPQTKGPDSTANASKAPPAPLTQIYGKLSPATSWISI
jgi:hypothetical protein